MQRRNFLKRILATSLLASPVVSALSFAEPKPQKLYQGKAQEAPFLYDPQIGWNPVMGENIFPKPRRKGSRRGNRFEAARNRVIANPAYTTKNRIR